MKAVSSIFAKALGAKGKSRVPEKLRPVLARIEKAIKYLTEAGR